MEIRVPFTKKVLRVELNPPKLEPKTVTKIVRVLVPFCKSNMEMY